MKRAAQQRSTSRTKASKSAADTDVTLNAKSTSALREHVSVTVKQYLTELDGELTTGFYEMVLTQVEAPLLKEIMDYTNDNQTKASTLLGLNRGTLRKKLKQYNLLAKGNN